MDERDEIITAVRISGVKEGSAARVNGVFELTDQKSNDRPLFKKQDSDDIWLRFTKQGAWVVSRTKSLSANDNGGWLKSDASGIKPWHCQRWSAWLFEAWKPQTSVVVEALPSEASTSVAPAASDNALDAQLEPAPVPATEPAPAAAPEPASMTDDVHVPFHEEDQALARLRRHHSKTSDWWWIFDDALALAGKQLASQCFLHLSSFIPSTDALLLLNDFKKLQASGHQRGGDKTTFKAGFLAGDNTGGGVTYVHEKARGDMVMWCNGSETNIWTGMRDWKGR